jgi:hypothetical protein
MKRVIFSDAVSSIAQLLLWDVLADRPFDDRWATGE